jgi:hypothetical protein
MLQTIPKLSEAIYNKKFLKNSFTRTLFFAFHLKIFEITFDIVILSLIDQILLIEGHTNIKLVGFGHIDAHYVNNMAKGATLSFWHVPL